MCLLYCRVVVLLKKLLYSTFCNQCSNNYILQHSELILTFRKMEYIDFVIKFAYFDMLSMRQIFRQNHFGVSHNPVLHSFHSFARGYSYSTLSESCILFCEIKQSEFNSLKKPGLSYTNREYFFI